MSLKLGSMSLSGNTKVSPFFKAQASQVDSIRKGLANSSLSQREAGELLKGQETLAREIAKAQKDGKVSAGEQRHLDKLMASTGEALTKALRNGERGNHGAAAPRASMQQYDQLGSLANGLRRGSLTSTEVAPLMREQAGIAKGIHSRAADGVVDSFEDYTLKKEQDHAAGSIALAHILITDDKGKSRLPGGYVGVRPA